MKSTEKTSFKEFRELLILLYADNVVSDEEFLLLYDTFSSKNPDLPHGNYERFDPDSMNSAECKAGFRVEKQDLPRLVAARQLPPVFKREQRSICDDIEGLCMLLKRVAYPCRLSDMIPRFGRPVSLISLITNEVMDYIFDVRGHLLTQWNQDLLNPGALERYADARVQMPYQEKAPPSTIVLVLSMGQCDPFQDLVNIRKVFIMDIKGSMP